MYGPSDEDSYSSSSVDTPPLSVAASENEDTDPEGEEKQCSVCGDRATGYHFHVLSCEGCKGFFRRSISKGVRFTCPFTRSCTINKTQRRQCQSCRLQKCLDAGMRKEMIMSHESLMLRRALRNQKKQERLKRMEQTTLVGLTDEQQQMIEILKRSHKTNFNDSMPRVFELQPPERLFANSRQRRERGCWSPSSLSMSSCSMSPVSDESLSLDFEMLCDEAGLLQTGEQICPDEATVMLKHFSDVSTFMIQQLIKFSKEIPEFRALTMDDQIALLKGAAFEVTQIQCNIIFDEDTLTWNCGELCYSIDDCIIVGIHQLYLDLAVKFHVNLKKLRLHEEEYVLMEAIALFAPDRPGVLQRDLIDQIHENMALTLQCYIQQRHPLPEGRFLTVPLFLSGRHLPPIAFLGISCDHLSRLTRASYPLCVGVPLLLNPIHGIAELKDGLVNLHPSTSVGMQNSFAIPRFLYAKLLCLLTELRTLNVENTKEIIHMHNRSANSVSPLLQELVS